MPNLTITVDDTSPIFRLSPESSWLSASAQVDWALSLFYESTASFTNVSNANMSFEFFGNSLKIYGSKRENHGRYQVQVDETIYDPEDGHLDAPGRFQQELFSDDGLENGIHLVSITNLDAGKYLDVDFVTWKSELSTEDENALIKTVQDSSPAIQYDGSWTTDPNNLGTFFGGTGHVSTQPGSFMQFVFTGSAIAIYGPLDPNGAPYTVQIDDEVPQDYSFTTLQYIPQSLLYFRGGLKTGKRTVKVTHTGADNNTLAIDYMNIYTTPTIEALSDDKLPPTTIAAIAIGTIAGLILFLITMYYCTRREKMWASESRISRIFSLDWWKYGPNDQLEGASRVRRKYTSEGFDLDGGGQYSAVKTSDKENEYVIPNFGPPGVTGSSTSGTPRPRNSSFGSGGDATEMGRLSAFSEGASSSTGASGLHTKQQSSLSGLSVLNQPLVRPRGSTDVGAGASINAARQLSPPPESTPSLTPQRIASVTPTPCTTTFFSATSQSRATSTSPPPNASINQRTPRPGDNTRQTVLSWRPQSASESYLSSQASSFQAGLQRKQTIVPPLPPGAAKPVPQVEMGAGELGELRSPASSGSATRNSGSGVLGRAGSGNRGSGVVGPRVRSLTGSAGLKTSMEMKPVDAALPDYRPGVARTTDGSGLARG